MVVSGGDNGAEADQWLVTSKNLLASSDFKGAKALAIRSCEDDPSRTHAADYIIAISDTLLAGESTVGDSNLPDWYAVLRLDKPTKSLEHIAVQYRRLALLLNPTVNRLPFADQALKLVSDAWCVLSDPPRKSIYDRELQLSRLGQFSQPQSQPEQFQSQAETSENHKARSFWTACPYCYALFEYPKGYEECALRCQQCGRAFEAVKTETPPVESNGQGVYFFCSWAMFPVGFSGQAKSSDSGWSPISNLFHCPVESSDHQANLKTPDSRNCHEVDGGGDELYITISDDDDDEGRDAAKKNKKEGDIKGTEFF